MELSCLNGSADRGKVTILQPKFQAHTVVSAAVMNGKCDLVLSAGSDFHFICEESAWEGWQFCLDISRSLHLRT